MADPFVAEIRIFGFNFAPKGWAYCDGQLLPLSQNTALFSLLGTTYGGDGKSTFALPDLQGNAPMHPGQGPGLSLHDLGETAGSQTVTLLQSEMPFHNHALIMASSFTADYPLPGPDVALGRGVGDLPYGPHILNGYDGISVPGARGGSLPHNNMMPSLVLNFCIALQGVFPPRT